jgi:hypothetical protein
VDHCASITLFSLLHSNAAGTMLKFAAIGVMSVPQKPDSMPIALTTVASPPKRRTTTGRPTEAVMTGNAANAFPMSMVKSAIPTQ